jgi:hypothetical protein
VSGCDREASIMWRPRHEQGRRATGGGGGGGAPAIAVPGITVLCDF